MTRKKSPFNYNHIFVDTNVLVGGYSGDARFKKDEACLHYLYSLTGKKLYISTLSVAQLISTFQKKKKKKNDEIVRIVRDLQHRFNVIDFAARDIDAALGLFIPLIVVNCIILGRAEGFASKNSPLASLFDGIGIGLGFTIGLTLLGICRELLGSGSIFGLTLLPETYNILLFVLPPGAFIMLGFLIAIVNKLRSN